MKWTTSWASVASNVASAKGSCSAVARRTSTPGYRCRAASTKEAEGSTAATRSPRLARPARRRAHRAAADIQHSQPRTDHREIGELRRQTARVAAHETVVRLGGDFEAHQDTLDVAPTDRYPRPFGSEATVEWHLPHQRPGYWTRTVECVNVMLWPRKKMLGWVEKPSPVL